MGPGFGEAIGRELFKFICLVAVLAALMGAGTVGLIWWLR